VAWRATLPAGSVALDRQLSSTQNQRVAANRRASHLSGPSEWLNVGQVAARSPISITVIKTLFAATPNVCSYTGCDEVLTNPAWQEVNAEIAHICGERPGAPRFDAMMSDAERNGYDNLILLCPKHHKLIDRLDPGGHPVDRLREMKAKSEIHGASARPWANEAELTRLALRLMAASSDPDSSTSGAKPRLRVLRSGKRVSITNSGSGTAHNIELLDEHPDESPILLGESPVSLPAGGRFHVGHWAQTFGTRKSTTLIVSWQDEHGSTYVDRFPVN